MADGVGLGFQGSAESTAAWLERQARDGILEVGLRVAAELGESEFDWARCVRRTPIGGAVNPIEVIRRTAEQTLGPLALPVELWADGLTDVLNLLRGSVLGDDLDEWDPEYISRTLPALWAVLSVYFRPDVRGLERIPAEGPALLVGTTPEGR